jgi:hypothetical protein
MAKRKAQGAVLALEEETNNKRFMVVLRLTDIATKTPDLLS